VYTNYTVFFYIGLHRQFEAHSYGQAFVYGAPYDKHALRKVIIFNVLYIYIWTGPIQNDNCMALGPVSGNVSIRRRHIELIRLYRNLVFAQLGEVKSPLVKYSCKYSLVVASC